MPPRYMTWGEVVGFGSEHVFLTIIFGVLAGLTIGATYNTDSQMIGIFIGIIILEIGLVGMAIKSISDGVSFAMYHNSNSSIDNGRKVQRTSSNNIEQSSGSRPVYTNYNYLFPAFTKICANLLSKLQYYDNPKPFYYDNKDITPLIIKGLENPVSLQSSEKKTFVWCMNIYLENLTPEQVTEFRNSEQFDTYQKVVEHFCS